MKQFMTLIACGAVVFAVLWGAKPTQPAWAQDSGGLPLGKACSIQLRKDVFGESAGVAGLPYVPNDAKYQLKGTLVATFDNWLALKVSDSRMHWIRYDSVMMVTVDTSPEK